MARGAQGAIVRGVSESDTTEQLSMQAHHNTTNTHIEIFFYFWSKSTLAMMY